MRSSSHRRRVVQVAGLVLVAALLLSGCLSEGQTAVHNELNSDRRALKLSTLPTHDQLNRKAQAWAEKLARDGKLSHSTLTDGVPSCWQSLAENVGYGRTAAEVQNAYMASAGHRANIVNTKWKWVGVGYAKSGSRVYTVQVFMKGC